MGKPIRYVREREIEPAIDRILFYAGAARLIQGEVTSSAPGHLLNLVLKEPVGVCGLITPVERPRRPAIAQDRGRDRHRLHVRAQAGQRRAGVVDGDLRAARPDRGAAARRRQRRRRPGRGHRRGARRRPAASTRSASPGSSEVGRRLMELGARNFKRVADRGRRQGAGDRVPGREPRQGDRRGRCRDLPVRRPVLYGRARGCCSIARSTMRSSTG